jgi:hypothetical protein
LLQLNAGVVGNLSVDVVVEVDRSLALSSVGIRLPDFIEEGKVFSNMRPSPRSAHVPEAGEDCREEP